MKTNRLILVGLLGTFASAAYASSGTDGASFLNIPVGAGPAAMGSAYTAIATNAYAPVWNPAGLGRISGTEFSAQHLSYLESMNYEFLSIVHPLNKDDSQTRRGIGFSMQYLGSGDISRTDIDSSGNKINNGDPIGSFSSSFASYNLSYGQAYGENLALGMTGKMITANIDNVSARAYAMDLAGLYRIDEKTQLAASVVNIGTKLKFLNEGDSLPMAFKVGGAYRPSSHYLLSTEAVYAKTGQANARLGAQWHPVDIISLRAGYRTDTLKGLSPLAGFSTGLGIQVWGQEFAYAWTPYGDLGDTQYFSFLIHFGAQEQSRRNLIQYQTMKCDPARDLRKTSRPDDMIEPEYQQLMQLLGDSDTVSAAAHPSMEKVDR